MRFNYSSPLSKQILNKLRREFDIEECILSPHDFDEVYADYFEAGKIDKSGDTWFKVNGFNCIFRKDEHEEDHEQY